MEKFLLQLKGNYMLVPILCLIAIIITFMDSRIFKKKRENIDYLKIALWTAVVSGVCVYIGALKGSIREEILTGPPSF